MEVECLTADHYYKMFNLNGRLTWANDQIPFASFRGRSVSGGGNGIVRQPTRSLATSDCITSPRHNLCQLEGFTNFNPHIVACDWKLRELSLIGQMYNSVIGVSVTRQGYYFCPCNIGMVVNLPCNPIIFWVLQRKIIQRPPWLMISGCIRLGQPTGL